MLDKLLVLLENTNIKNIGNALKKDPELLCWVKEKSSHILAPETITERIYVLVNDIASNTCNRGNKLKFKSYTAGYGYCGPAGKCECAREQVSKKVSSSKQELSQEQKDLINSRRVETNLQKYGVENVFQLDEIKEKSKITNLKNYGVDNPNKTRSVRIKIEETNSSNHPITSLIFGFALSKERKIISTHN